MQSHAPLPNQPVPAPARVLQVLVGGARIRGRALVPAKKSSNLIKTTEPVDEEWVRLRRNVRDIIFVGQRVLAVVDLLLSSLQDNCVGLAFLPSFS